MSGFCKLSSELVKSSIWSEDYPTRIVWLSLLSLKDASGFVTGSRISMYRICNVTQDEFDSSIKKLEAPDINSRNKDNEGRRIKTVEGGWVILNHQKYRDYNYSYTIDANRMREKRLNKDSDDPLFVEFWKIYPKKTSRLNALKYWNKNHIDQNTFLKIKKALEWQTKLPNWIKDNGQYIPMASTYINQKRWEDESNIILIVESSEIKEKEEDIPIMSQNDIQQLANKIMNQ